MLQIVNVLTVEPIEYRNYTVPFYIWLTVCNIEILSKLCGHGQCNEVPRGRTTL